ncbi:lactase-like protein isoform X2 [Pectinophora gossypiella]|nr:lactase-like protein isoform X2 [Pectinophora gossypiella]
MWDHLVRTDPGHIADHSNADVAANSYHLYKRDVQMLKELGVSAYRFSISWPRIMPYGRPDYVNPRGIQYYNNLIDELLANNIQPFPTMYHWDLPQNLNEQGGILSENFPDWFGDYARVLYQNFGDRVKHWLTLNEPYIHCHIGFGTGMHAPRIRSPGVGYYRCGRQILLAHARAFHIYNDEGFRSAQNGQLGIVISMDWSIPSTDSVDDAEAVTDYIAFKFGQYMDPLFSEQGNYPQRILERVATNSALEGLSTTRLPAFTDAEAEYLRGTSDFLALNHYSTAVVYRNASVAGMHEVPSMFNDVYIGSYSDPSWPMSETNWSAEYAPGLYNLLNYIKDTYNNPTIYITENGFSSFTGLVDDQRCQYYKNYLVAVQQAIESGVDLRGYFAWSLMDNFEWARGYTIRFGLYEIDMTDPERTRTPRKSALVYKEIIRSRVVDMDYNPDPYLPGSSHLVTGSALTVVVAALYNLLR